MNHNSTSLEGVVTAVFAHRFVIDTASGPALADLGPKGAERIIIQVGHHVKLVGEQKPSELKIHSIAKNGAEAVAVEHPKRPAGDDHDQADPADALTTLKDHGFTILSAPRRKPKHFEILGRDAIGNLAELHVDLDGKLRKSQPVTAADQKWAPDIRAAMA